MANKLPAVLDALLPAALVAILAGTCIAAADYIAVIAIERFLEQWAWLPPGWGALHGPALAVAAVLLAAPVTGFIAWWMYRRARAAQAQEGEPR